MQPNRKFLITLEGDLSVEAVWYASGTLCLSSQAGCALACPFCASGTLGLRRNLTAAELQQQLDTCRKAGIEPERLTLSGIGEPLQNLANVRDFIADCSRRKLPVSLTTTGAPLTLLTELLELPHNGLMFSLHAATEATYRRLIPKGPGAGLLQEKLLEAWPHLSGRKRRKLGVNCLLLEGVNDGPEEMAALGNWLRPFPEMTLHLLYCNPVAGSPYRSPATATVDRIQDELRRWGINVRRANRWRRQEEGGCGTLVLGGSADSEVPPSP